MMPCCGGKAPKEAANTDPFFFTDTPATKTIKLFRVDEISPDTRRLRFALPHKSMKLGLPVGGHFLLNFPNPGYVPGLDENGLDPKTGKCPQWNEQEDIEADCLVLTRPYTPVSGDELPGFVDLVVKIYEKSPQKGFPDGGHAGQWIKKALAKAGQTVEVDGPYGKIRWINKSEGGDQYFQIGSPEYGGLEHRPEHVLLIAGGSGITPCFRMLKECLAVEGTTTFSLVYSNRTEADILLKSEIEALAAANPARLKVHFTLTGEGASATGCSGENVSSSTGRISAEMVGKVVSGEVKGVLTLLCGPTGMQRAARNTVKELGGEHVYEF